MSPSPDEEGLGSVVVMRRKGGGERRGRGVLMMGEEERGEEGRSRMRIESTAQDLEERN